MIKVIATLAAILFAASLSFAYAEEDEKLSFAGYLEETLGHFWAIEQNLDDSNAELALVHATHPIAELYDSMKPELKEANPEFDSKVQKTLLDLGKKTGKDVSRQDAQKALDDAKEIIDDARSIIVGDELSSDPKFRAKLMIGLLSTSKGEYEEAIKNGQIEMMAEFQDGSAFVWRSQQIFDEIKSDLPENQAGEVESSYPQIWDAYKSHAAPSEIATLVDGVIRELNEFTGEESEGVNLNTYFENIDELLTDANKEYSEGNTDEALSLVTKAYLDNYEFLESPIGKQDKDLMKEIEVLMREELRDMIKTGASADDVSTQVDSILEKLNTAKGLVPTEEHEEDEDIVAPLKQVKAGIAPKDVDCGEYLELVIKKSSGVPACVKSETAEKLVKLGWGTRQ